MLEWVGGWVKCGLVENGVLAPYELYHLCSQLTRYENANTHVRYLRRTCLYNCVVTDISVCDSLAYIQMEVSGIKVKK